MKRFFPRASRRGAVIQESVMAIMIAVAVLLGVAQVLAFIAQQQRVAQRRTVARHAAGNYMEEAMSRPWSQLTSEQLSKGLSPSLPTLLWDARCQVEVVPEDANDLVRRIVIQIDWPNATEGRASARAIGRLEIPPNGGKAMTNPYVFPWDRHPACRNLGRSDRLEAYPTSDVLEACPAVFSRRCRRTRRQHAYTLIECLVMMALVGATLGATSVMLHGLQRADRRLRDEGDKERTFDNFVHQWREDVHRAATAKAEPVPGQGSRPRHLILTRDDDRVVEYLLDDQELTRVVRDGDKVRQRESFAVNLSALAEWRIDTSQDHSMVWFELSPDGGQVSLPSIERVAAAIGLRHKL